MRLSISLGIELAPGRKRRRCNPSSALSDLAERFPVLKSSLDIADPPLSYTQWEAYLAVYHGKVLLIAAAAPEAPRDGNRPIDLKLQAAQQAHRERLRQFGRHPEITFANKDQLIAEVFRGTVLDLLAKAQSGPRQVSNIPIRVPSISWGATMRSQHRDGTEGTRTASLSRRCMGCVESARPRLQPPMRSAIATTISRLGGSGRRPSPPCAPTRRARRTAGLGRRRREGRAGDRGSDGAAAARRRRHSAHLRQRNGCRSLKPYLPPGGRRAILVTSNAHAWRGMAAPVEIRLWPIAIGADYLIAADGPRGGARHGRGAVRGARRAAVSPRTGRRPIASG